MDRPSFFCAIEVRLQTVTIGKSLFTGGGIVPGMSRRMNAKFGFWEFQS